MSVTGQNVVRMEWRGTLVRGMVEHAAEEGNRHAAENLLEDANEHVPYDLGNLESTGQVTQARDRGGRFGSEHFVSYDAPYAIRLHEHPEYQFQGKGEGKWLENAARRRSGHVDEYVAPFMRGFAMP